MGLIESRRVGIQRAVDLVGTHMQETKRLFFCGWQSLPILSDDLQQPERTHHVRLDEVLRTVDGAVHMRFGSKVDDRAGLMLCQ